MCCCHAKNASDWTKQKLLKNVGVFSAQPGLYQLNQILLYNLMMMCLEKYPALSEGVELEWG